MLSRRQIKLITSILVIILSAAAIVFSDNPSKFVSKSMSKPVSTAPTLSFEADQEVEADSVYIASTPAAPPSISPEEQSVAEEQELGYPVVKVVDGDTIDVNIEGIVERLRLIGMDTPETVDPRKPVQCFGREASNKAKELLTNKLVTLESDPTQGERDKYGRLLRYVFLPDGTNYDLFMIEEGYAHEYTYHLPYKYQSDFKQAEINARNNNKGLWAAETCSGNK